MVRIPEFIKLVAERKFEEAYEVITSTNSLPAICGRVCPQENQCEEVCVRGIKGEPVGIGRLERFVADYHDVHAKDAVGETEKRTGPRIGSAILTTWTALRARPMSWEGMRCIV